MIIKVVRSGDVFQIQVVGSWQEQDSKLSFTIEVSCPVSSCVLENERNMTIRAAAGQIFGKAADRLRRSLIHAVERGLREVLSRAIASGHGEGWSAVLGPLGPDDIEILLSRVSRSGGDGDDS